MLYYRIKPASEGSSRKKDPARKPPRRQRVSEKAGLESRLTKLLGKIIRRRDHDRCQKCVISAREGHVHHVIPKAQGKVLRFDKQNLLLLCVECHDWAHKHRLAFCNWFDRTFPIRSEYIEDKRYQVCKRTDKDLEEMERVFEQELLRADSDLFAF
jgi:5-methylcytosine-specific restriction endonuclease McrA